MIFKRHRIDLEFSSSGFWSPNMKSTTVVVQERKYRILRNQNQILIERKIYDIRDLVGFIQFKRLGIAQGEISKDSTSTILNLEVRINQPIEIIFLTSIVIFAFISLWIMTQEFALGLIFLFGSLLISGLIYLTITYGINGFYSDLHNDIDYFG